MTINLPTPHGDKLTALLSNEKLPQCDQSTINDQINKYNQWINDLTSLQGDQSHIIERSVDLLNEYRNHLDLNVIFDSSEIFFYRQKGQLKLDNSVIEEFLPHLVTKCFPDKFDNPNISIGPTKCFSAIRFESNLLNITNGGGMFIRSKDQDFAISKNLFIKTSFTQDFSQYEEKQSYLAYITAECKTNLDKTMFQEAAATAIDVKTTVPSAKYLLLCEWLDMTPISTATTAIEEVIILRKAKRMSSNIRKNFNSVQGRSENRTLYQNFLNTNPFSADAFYRFIEHINSIISDENVLNRGYF